MNLSGGRRYAVEAGGTGSNWEKEVWSAASSAYLKVERLQEDRKKKRKEETERERKKEEEEESLRNPERSWFFREMKRTREKKNICRQKEERKNW